MDQTLFMAQMGVINPPDILRTTLGSCIGIVLIDGDRRYGLAHIMLPRAAGNTKEEGKFADTAIPSLIRKMGLNPTEASRLKAKIAGGANMFPQVTNKNLESIGKSNIQVVKEVLTALRISIVAEDLGGEKGRQMVIDAEKNKVYVKSIGGVMHEL